MTSEEFGRHFHLLDRVSTGAVETYHAHAASGAMVMAHFLRGDEHDNAAILHLVDNLKPEFQRRLLRSDTVDGTTVIVTRFILDLTTFQDWLHQGAATTAPPHQTQPQPQIHAEPTPPDAPRAVAPPPTPPQPAPPPLPDFAPPAADAAPAEPGELTRMFSAAQLGIDIGNTAPPPAEPSQPQTPAPVDIVAPPPPPDIIAPPPPPALDIVAPPAPPPPAPEPFMRPPVEPLADVPLRMRLGEETPLLPGTEAPPAPLQESHYTQMFKPAVRPPPEPTSPAAPPAAAAPSFATPADAYFERLSRLEAPPPPAPPPSQPAPSFSSFGGAAEPSEFTRVISAVAPPLPAPPPAAPPAAEPAAPPPSGNKRLIIAAASLLIVTTLVIVLVLVFRSP